jgi:uncharacterized protein (DUF1800 family)
MAIAGVQPPGSNLDQAMDQTPIGKLRRAAVVLGFLALVVPIAAVAQPASPRTLALVDRITWGKTSASVRNATDMGVDRWLKSQLRPPPQSILPPEVQARIDLMRISTEPMERLAVAMDAQNKAAGQIQTPPERQAAQQAYQRAMADLKRQAASRSLLRDLYSPDQLREQMTWFWVNHFSVQADKRDIRAMIGNYEDQAIRPHALGKFRDLLGAAALHPAMLRYLDNDQNAVGHLNENYAREILELHTLGVGSGYSQKDVEEMARVLTGVGVSLSPDTPKLKPEQQALYVRRGLLEFNPARHDFGPKVLLGEPVTGSGLGELDQALDRLARAPATARHISTKLALYFTGQAPPKLVERMSKTFLRTDGDIAKVLETLFGSEEFQASLGKKTKDPIHFTLSAVRLAYDGRTVVSTAPIESWLTRMGQGLYGRETPDGYPLEDTAWTGPGQLTTLFEVAQQIGSNTSGLFKPEGPNAVDAPAFPQLQNALFYSSTQPQLSAQTQTALAQTKSLAEWNSLYLSSPEFLHR